MATKKTTTTTTRRTTTTGKGWLLRACSYFALVVAAFMFLFGGIFSGAAKSVLNLIGQLFMLVGIGIPPTIIRAVRKLLGASSIGLRLQFMCSAAYSAS